MKGSVLKYAAAYLGTLYLLTVLVPFGAHMLTHSPRQEAGREQPPAFAETAAILSGTPAAEPPAPSPAAASAGEFRLYDAATGETSTVSDRDFLIGSLACEMAPDVPLEALKAQTVAAYSYYSDIRSERADKDYDLTWDSAGTLVWKPTATLEAEWGESAADNLARLTEAVDAVSGQTLTYEGAVACAAFFPLSSGRTENASELWGQDYPYLVSVASPYDTLSSDYERSYTLSPERVQEMAAAYWTRGTMDFGLPPEQWFSDVTYTVGGSVMSLGICGFSVTGSEAATAFSLGSSVFMVEYSDGNFQFRAKGRGHGVGMSQTGAVYMAAEGAAYTEILNWYFPGTTLSGE